jgi:hypothetical protein
VLVNKGGYLEEGCSVARDGSLYRVSVFWRWSNVFLYGWGSENGDQTAGLLNYRHFFLGTPCMRTQLTGSACTQIPGIG